MKKQWNTMLILILSVLMMAALLTGTALAEEKYDHDTGADETGTEQIEVVMDAEADSSSENIQNLLNLPQNEQTEQDEVQEQNYVIEESTAEEETVVSELLQETFPEEDLTADEGMNSEMGSEENDPADDFYIEETEKVTTQQDLFAISAQELVLNQEAAAVIKAEKESCWFKYKPSVSGTYTFFCFNASEIETSGVLYDENMTELYSEMGCPNYFVTYDLEADKVYYYSVCYSDNTETGMFSVMLTDVTENHLTVLPLGSEGNDNDLSVCADHGETVTLSVDVSADVMEGIYYQWTFCTEDGDQFIEGADSSEYTINNVESSGDYTCSVTDFLNHTEFAYFHVSVNNRFSAYAADSENNYAVLEAVPGGSLDLEVTVKSDDMTSVTWKWYKGWYDGAPADDAAIHGAVSSKYTLSDIRETGVYSCSVSDGYGNSQWVYFEVTIQNHLTVTAEQTTYNVPVHGNAELSITAAADDPHLISYQWMQGARNGNGFMPVSILDQEISNTLKLTDVTESTAYSCFVTDGYDNSAEIIFDIYVSEDAVESISLNENELTLETKQKYTLKAVVSPENASDTNVKWSSSNSKVASVDENGIVTALTYGTAVITATAEDDTNGTISASCAVQTRYYDVAQSGTYWFAPVYWAADQGITKGYGNVYFGPEENCTREQMITFLYREAGSPAVYGSVPFTDVASGTYYYKAVLWAYNNGITKGYSSGPYKGKFGVGLTVTREDTVTFIYRMAEKPAYSKTAAFSDVSKGKYYYDAIMWAAENSITKGYSSGVNKGKFGVGFNVLRKDIVTFLYRYNAKYGG